jgi:hypothetical protein
MQEDERGVRSEAVSVSQAVPEKRINKIDSTKQSPKERSERKRELLDRLRYFGWRKKKEKEDEPKIENTENRKNTRRKKK